MAEEIKICDVCIIDDRGAKIKIGTAKLEIILLERTMISPKEKRITLKNLNIEFDEGDKLYDTGGSTLNILDSLKI